MVVVVVVGMLVVVEVEEAGNDDDHRCTRRGSSLVVLPKSSFHESLQSAMMIFAMPSRKLMEWLPLVTVVTMLQQLPVGWNEDVDYSIVVPDVVVLPH